MILFYILIGMAFIFHLLDMVKDLIDKEYHLASQDKKDVNFLMIERIKNIMNDYWITPKMYASNPASFEEQIHLFMDILHPNIELMGKYQTFKASYGVLSTQMLSSKYDFESSPTIVEVMKDYCDSL